MTATAKPAPQLNWAFWIWFILGCYLLRKGWIRAFGDASMPALGAGVLCILAAIFVDAAQRLRADGAKRPWATLGIVSLAVLALQWGARGVMLALAALVIIPYNYYKLTTRDCVDSIGVVRHDEVCGTQRVYLPDADGRYVSGTMAQMRATWWQTPDGEWHRVDLGGQLPEGAQRQAARRDTRLQAYVYDSSVPGGPLTYVPAAEAARLAAEDARLRKTDKPSHSLE
jgi:hypothetical protein